jgi:hypothetical membrane protein
VVTLVPATARERVRERHGAFREPAVLLLAGLAPVVLTVGVLLAQAVQRAGGYDPVRQTVSTLAGRGAQDRWVMTTTLLLLGGMYLGVAAGLRAPRPGRWVLGVGAAALLVTGLAPQPVGSSSVVHMAAMTLGCVAFTTWPFGLLSEPHLRAGSLVAVGAMVAALAWLCAQAWTDGTWLGVAERVVLLTLTVWPVRVAMGTRRLGSATRWTLVLALLPPVVLAVGLVAAQAAQPAVDTLNSSLSALARLGAPDRWILTVTVLVVGVSYVGVAAGLRLVPPLGRVLLGLGGGLLVVSALFPQPAVGVSWVHMVAGALAWAGFTTWPLTLVASRSAGPRLRRVSPVATGALLVLLGWFTVQLVTSGTWYGLSERITITAMGVWPIVVAVRGAAPGRPSRCGRPAPTRTP